MSRVPSWVDAPEAIAPQPGTVGGSTRVQALLSVALRYGLWGALVLALVLGVVNVVGLPGVGSPPQVTGAAEVSQVPPPSGCAELVVAAWLAGDGEVLAGVAGMPRSQPESGQRRAVHTYVAEVNPGPAAWGYLIAAQVQQRIEEPADSDAAEQPEEPEEPEARDPGWRDTGVQFFAVTMVPAGGGCQGWAPAALPAQVAGPELTSPALSYPVSLAASGTELSETLEAFFAGMLTGAGNPERFVAPGTVVEFPSPPPYQEVAVTGLRTRQDTVVDGNGDVPADGTVVPLLVTVTAGAGDDTDLLPLMYPVTVEVRGGRWEVVALESLVEGG